MVENVQDGVGLVVGVVQDSVGLVVGGDQDGVGLVEGNVQDGSGLGLSGPELQESGNPGRCGPGGRSGHGR